MNGPIYRLYVVHATKPDVNLFVLCYNVVHYCLCCIMFTFFCAKLSNWLVITSLLFVVEWSVKENVTRSIMDVLQNFVGELGCSA